MAEQISVLIENTGGRLKVPSSLDTAILATKEQLQ